MQLMDFTQKYQIIAVSGTPDVVESLLRDLKTAEDPRWDRKPDPSRFSLREIVAHLADWNPIIEERIRRMRSETDPVLQSYDEGEFAVKNDYAHSDPIENMKRFRKGRASIVALYREIGDDEWERGGLYAGIHRITIETYLAWISGHDGYHTGQIAQWLR